MQCLSKEVLKRTLKDLGWVIWWGVSKKYGYALDWLLSGSRADSMLGYRNHSYLESRTNRVRLNFDEREAAISHVTRIGGVGSFLWFE